MSIRKIIKKTRYYLKGNNNSNYSKKDTYISKEEYKELNTYAQEKGIKISNFRKFKGDIELIKELIDDISDIAKDFSLILEGRKSITLELDYHCDENDFATTVHHIIYLNANMFSDKEYLNAEYNTIMLQGKYVASTNYRAIVRHEVGHVVANIYKINPMEVAKKLLKTNFTTDVLSDIKVNLSLYAGEYSDGREIISESFSAYYSENDNSFANDFVKMCIKSKGGNDNEKK